MCATFLETSTAIHVPSLQFKVFRAGGILWVGSAGKTLLRIFSKQEVKLEAANIWHMCQASTPHWTERAPSLCSVSRRRGRATPLINSYFPEH